MLISEVYNEIISLTQELIGKGLSVQENFPSRDGTSVSWTNKGSISQLLRNMSYLDKYKLLIETENFNFKLLDGAVVQILYSFDETGNELRAHRLAYYPSPILERYETAPVDYETKYFGDSEFHDLFQRYVVTFPIRFDYTFSTPPFVDIHHPFSHLHLGDIETCRIPLKGPITPSHFINFILRNFYNTALLEYCDDMHFKSPLVFKSTITEKESALVHISFI